MSKQNDIVGLVPAAGYARRISPLPCSKEVYPIMQQDCSAPKVVSSYLLESLREAGIKQTYLVLRSGKWDIPEYFKDGANVGLNLAFVVSEGTDGVPQTIEKAYPFIKDNKVAFGFPDILFNPSHVFIQLLEEQQNTGADLVLGLFKATDHLKADMVMFNSVGDLQNIVIKPEETDLTYTWINAVWTPVFSDFLHGFLNNEDYLLENNFGELFIGDIVREAIFSGLKTAYVKFKNGSYLDIGTPSSLANVNSVQWSVRSEIV